ncbi:secreted RxLR effector protein 78-like [Telopea speciosissima]|uniref:secreted RxLR effector protein 78-like n=1 Tax=Telopea speciosissima TaxID=54955 RepID=UPI001CC78600|nr:secreted RxLR effector protein 78-like [Telopea speciosissima]
MASRLSTVLHELISIEQGAFQKGKVIFENIGVASELTNMMFAKCRGGGMGMKLDIQKAFNILDLSYLFDVLCAFGFSPIWVSWVHQILLSTRISVLINRCPVGFFGVERGLRQGDPLSPLMFILSKEVLCRGLSALREMGWLNALPGPR